MKKKSYLSGVALLCLILSGCAETVPTTIPETTPAISTENIAKEEEPQTTIGNIIDLDGDGVPDEPVTKNVIPLTEPETTLPEETQPTQTEPVTTEPREARTQTPTSSNEETNPVVDLPTAPPTEPDTPEEETQPATTAVPANAVSISAEVSGTHYIGSSLGAADFTIKVTMDDGSTLTNPPGWYAAPLELTGETTVITVGYKDITGTVTVTATEKPTTPATEPETSEQAQSGAYTRIVREDGAILYDIGASVTVCVDAGHQAQGNSAKEPNAPGSEVLKTAVATGTSGVATGIAESVMNLNVALKLRDELLSRGYNVLMVRESQDVNITNITRALMGNTATICVHIHGNGVDNQSVHGTLCAVPTTANPYTTAICGDCTMLGLSIVNGICGKCGSQNRGLWGTDEMTTLNWATVPTTIIELGFMTNPDEDVLMNTESYQVLMAAGIVDGIDAYFAAN
ncbi:MAG: N-acetylmuramoyl-L-alanine amidase [Lachnospiraceae bacterium]|nr:N-acetylmuramoyl-L-alanine amidase [Lachnospiraceae bacterium]